MAPVSVSAPYDRMLEGVPGVWESLN